MSESDRKNAIIELLVEKHGLVNRQAEAIVETHFGRLKDRWTDAQAARLMIHWDEFGHPTDRPSEEEVIEAMLEARRLFTKAKLELEEMVEKHPASLEARDADEKVKSMLMRFPKERRNVLLAKAIGPLFSDVLIETMEREGISGSVTRVDLP